MLVFSVLDSQMVIHQHAGVHVVFWTAELCSVLESQIVWYSDNWYHMHGIVCILMD